MDERLSKGDALAHWRSMPANQPIPEPRPVPYRHEGSTYGYDGIRIEGTKMFIDSILSRLKPLLEHESGRTRLSLQYQPVLDRHTKKPTGDWVCYVKVHARGRELPDTRRYGSY